MKYPYRVVIEDMSIIDKGLSIFVADERGPYDYCEDYDHYAAKTPEELLGFLMGVYDWHPSGWDGEGITWGG